MLIDDNADVVNELQLTEDKTNTPVPTGIFACCMNCFPSTPQ
jgi:hypothetical protein